MWRTENKVLQKFVENNPILTISHPSEIQLRSTAEWLQKSKKEYRAFHALKKENLSAQMVQHLALSVEMLSKKSWVVIRNKYRKGT